MEFSETSLAVPFLGMLGLTMLVWIYLFVQRFTYIGAHKIDAGDMKTPADVERLLPGDVQGASHNFKNLFELPVHILCAGFIFDGNRGRGQCLCLLCLGVFYLSCPTQSDSL